MICSVKGCARRPYCRGLCQRHYLRNKHHGNPLAGRTSGIDAREHIDELCSLPKGVECVIWPYSTDRDGYAKLGAKDRVCRVICERVHGKPENPKDHAAHSCGKGHEACVAWWHLEWKSGDENNKDKIKHGTSSRGETNPTANLTEADVRVIRASLEKVAVLADRYKVHKATIYNVKSGKTWSWLK